MTKKTTPSTVPGTNVRQGPTGDGRVSAASESAAHDAAIAGVADEQRQPDCRSQDTCEDTSEGKAYIDLAAINGIRTLEKAAPNLLASLVGRFLSESPQRLATMRRSLHDNDWEELGAATHLLKSSSALLGVGRLAGLCQILECASRNGATGYVQGLMEQIENEFILAEKALSKIVSPGG